MEQLESVLNSPQQVVPERGDQVVYQSQFERDDGKRVLLRAIVAEDQRVVITVYRTSRIQKYWRE